MVYPVILQGKYTEAESLYVRALNIGERTLGSDHPEFARWLVNRASSLEKQVRPCSTFQDASRDGMPDVIVLVGLPGRHEELRSSTRRIHASWATASNVQLTCFLDVRSTLG